MADYIDGSSAEEPGVSRRSLIKKGMLAGGVALWSVPVLAVVTRSGSSEGGTGTTQNIVPANHPGGVPVPPACQGQGSPATCINFVCVFPFTFTECVGTPPQFPIGQANVGPTACFCNVTTTGCACIANDDCVDLPDCIGGVCPAGFVCIPAANNCCGVPKCARPCT